MQRKKPRIAVITNVIAHYRLDLYRRILQNDELYCDVYCQQEIPGAEIISCHESFADSVVLLKYFSVPNEKLVWQCIPVVRLLKNYDVFFFYGNPRILSNLLFATLFRLLGKPVVIWGQARTAGPERLSEKLRLQWWKLFRHIFVYTDAEVDHLQRCGFSNSVITGMNNGLDQAAISNSIRHWVEAKLAAWKLDIGLANRPVLLSCARLVNKNEFSQIVLALPGLVEEWPDLLWCVIGDGPERRSLAKLASDIGVSDNIRFVGALYGENEIAPWFLSSKALVHPGAIGLSLLHAFGYGLPVITHNDSRYHMPEFSAFAANHTGLAFTRNSISSLQASILKLLSDESERLRYSANATSVAETKFNTRVMFDRFKAAARLAYENDSTGE